MGLFSGPRPAPPAPELATEPELVRDLSAAMWTSYVDLGNTEKLRTSFQSYAEDGYASNSIIFSVILARAMLFSEAVFKFRSTVDKKIFGTEALSILERPWPGATTGELLFRMEQDASIAGNAFVRVTDDGWLERLRPDLVDIVHAERADGSDQVVGYGFWRDGRVGDYEFYPVDEVAHWSPIPDPMSQFRGMSWMVPVAREINADQQMTAYKQAFFDNAATPNMLIRFPSTLNAAQAEMVAERVAARHGGAANAWKTLVIDQGADVTMIGNDFKSMTFTDVQAAGENRIAAAAGVPGIVVGLREGLQAATYSNYSQAMRRFADLTMRPLWRSVAAALEKLVAVPPAAHLWYDTTDIAALREGETERAQTAQVNAAAMQTLIAAGYTPDSVTRAVVSGDFALLQHTGLVSVQLQQPGSQSEPADPTADDEEPQDDEEST